MRALAQYLSGLLEKLPAVGERAPRDLSLLEPVDVAWIVASIAVGYDEARDRILVVANELLEEEEGGDPASARVLITRAQAAAFVKQADVLMKGAARSARGAASPRIPAGMPARGATATSSTETLDVLARGEVTLKGRMPWASNATFLVELALAGATTSRGVQAGARRAAALGFSARALQARARRVASLRGVRLGARAAHDRARRARTARARSSSSSTPTSSSTTSPCARSRSTAPQLQRMCLFDLVANNADRKSGHCLLGPDGIYGVDNGLCFHVEPKLRTVIWDFGGEPIPSEMLADVRRFTRAKLPKALADAPRSGRAEGAARPRVGARQLRAASPSTPAATATPGRSCRRPPPFHPPMPELPDVAVYIEALEARIAGATLERMRLASPFLLRSVDPPHRRVTSRRVTGLRRLGKRIVIGLEGDLFVMLHLMIAGRLHWKPAGAKLPGKIGLAAFDFSSGTLVLTEAGTKRRAALYLGARRGRARRARSGRARGARHATRRRSTPR